MANLIPVEGKPGAFMDKTTGEVLNIIEWREDDKYDTVALPAEGWAVAAGFAIPAGRQLNYFRDLQNKDLIDTNIRTPRSIPAGERMRIERIGIYVPSAFGNVISNPDDFRKVTEAGYLICQINRKDIAEGPLTKFNSGYGIAGSTTGGGSGAAVAGDGILNIGVPSTAAAAKLLREHNIDHNHELDATITFYDRRWASAAAIANAPLVNAAPTGVNSGVGNAATFSTSMPFIENAVAIRLYLHGLIRAAATAGT